MKLRGHCMMDPLNRNPKAFDFIIDSLKVQSLFIVMPTWKKYSILNFLSMRSTCKSFIIVKRHVVQGWAKFLHSLPFSCYASRFLQYRASTFVLPAFVPLGFLTSRLFLHQIHLRCSKWNGWGIIKRWL